jgi:hypothetical protein
MKMKKAKIQVNAIGFPLLLVSRLHLAGEATILTQSDEILDIGRGNI